MCTRFTVPYSYMDGLVPRHGVVVARTMDFASPTGETYVSFAPGNLGYWDPLHGNNKAYNKTQVWGRAKKVLDKFVLSDAANQYFSVEGLWLPETKYASRMGLLKPSVDKTDALTLMNWIMSGDIKDLDTMAKALRGLKPVALFWEKETSFLATIHMSITEWSTGKTIVLEIGTDGVAGQTKVYDADETGMGVMTNSPIYRSQIDNLRGYLSFNSPTNVQDTTIAGMKLHLTGNGNNLKGMPGSALPADRFVRTALQLELATQNNKNMTREKAKDTAAAIMNTVYVVDGTTSESAMMGLQTKWDSTLWCVIKHLENGKVVYLHRDSATSGFAERTDVINVGTQDPDVTPDTD